MENASKALIMAGGILIALLVIGALVLMFNQLSYYQRTETDSEKTQQLADFNKEYLKYTYDDIKGYELISLVNKVIDYNINNFFLSALKNKIYHNLFGSRPVSGLYKYTFLLYNKHKKISSRCKGEIYHVVFRTFEAVPQKAGHQPG